MGRLSCTWDRYRYWFRYDAAIVYVSRVIVDVYSFRVILCRSTSAFLQAPRLIELVWREDLSDGDVEIVELG